MSGSSFVSARRLCAGGHGDCMYGRPCVLAPPMWLESVNRATGAPRGWTDNLSWAIDLDGVTLALLKLACKRSHEITVYPSDARAGMLETNRRQLYERNRTDAIRAEDVDQVDQVDRLDRRFNAGLLR